MLIQVIQEGTAYFFNHLATILLFIVPLTALSTALLYLGRKKNLLYHLVFVLHVWSAVFLIGAVINVLHIPVNFFQVSVLGGLLYCAVAAKKAFNARWWEAGLKGILFSISSLLLMLIPLMAIITTLVVQKKSQGIHFGLGTSSQAISANSPEPVKAGPSR